MGNFDKCRFSSRLTFKGDDSYEFRENGYSDFYGCLNPEVIAVLTEIRYFIENEEIFPYAVLASFGKPDDPEVNVALKRACDTCKYFQIKV